MEKNKFYKGVIIALLLINLIMLILFIVHINHNRKFRHRPPAERLIKELQFNDQQTKDFYQLKSEHQHQMKSIHDSIRVEREKLPEVISQKNDRIAYSISLNIGRLQSRIEWYTYQHFIKVRGLCNDQQRIKFDSIIGDILKTMGEHEHRPPLHQK